MKKALKLLTLAIVLAITTVAFVACAPASVEKAKDKMEDKGYTILIAEELDEPTEEGVVGHISVKESGLLETDTLQATLFESRKKAKEMYEDYVDEFGDDNVWLKGKWILFGDEDIADDFA